MINRIYRLMDTKRIEMVLREVPFPQKGVLVQPDYMSICAADQRYYFGKRKRTILKQKLPMALIHEATGIVLYDFGNELTAGTKVVLIPLEPSAEHSDIKENYRPESRFLSSGADGFMQDMVVLPRNRIIPVQDDYSVIYVFSELVSVAMNALEAFEQTRMTKPDSFGVWGDGSMGYVTSLMLKCLYPNSEIYAFGKTARKLQRFSFVKKAFYIDNIPKGFHVNHCFECVGNIGSEDAIKQIIDVISPQGCVNLLGVSEDDIVINTREILSKGLRIIGNSRSDVNDFNKAVSMIRENELCRTYLRTLISEIIEITDEKDISRAFEQDMLNDFKTVLRWRM